MPTTDTKLLLHCDGADESTSFPDSSQSNHTVTPHGNAQVDTAEKKWGTGAALFDGVDDYLTIPDSPDWDIIASNSDNWTLDLWAKHDDHANEEYYLQQWEDALNYWRFNHAHGSGLIFYACQGGTPLINTGFGGEITDINPHHLAMCKVADKYGIYKDGNQVAYVQDNSIDTYAGTLYIGSDASITKDFDGWLDEIRIVHANPFGALPNAGLTDTIMVPTGPYGLWLHKFMGISDPAKAIGVNANYIGKILGV